MFLKRLILAAVIGLAATGAIAAPKKQPPPPPPPPPQENFFEVLGRAIGEAFANPAGSDYAAMPQTASVQQGQPGQAGQPLYSDMVSRYRMVPWEFRRQTVRFDSKEKPGTVIIDPARKFLYLVTGNGQAIRYGVGVGREGFGWRGVVNVARKAEWPGWTPPPQMIIREAKRGHKLPPYMPGGIANPLGARAMYLHTAGGDTGYRIHGTNEPWTIGLNVSSGCIRLNNDDVVDLYNRVPVGAKVVVM